MLFPMRGAHGYMQPFRFTSISAEERQILEKELTERLKQSMAPTPQATDQASGRRASTWNHSRVILRQSFVP